jgi:hypothetical protein
MKFYLYGLILVFTFSSCLKKNTEINELNTSIFDREYAGGPWFEVVKAFKYVNDIGQTKIRFDLVVPSEKITGLKGSFLPLAVRKNGGELFIGSWPLKTGGSYEGFVEFPVNAEGEYCVEVGIVDRTDSSVINAFTECRMIE